MYISLLIAAPVFLLFIVFFAGLELAYISSNKLTMELGRKQGTISGQFWSTAPQTINKFSGAFRLLYILFFILFSFSLSLVTAPFWDLLEKYFTGRLPVNSVIYLQLLAKILLSALILISVQSFARPYFRAKNYSLLTSGFIAVCARFFYALAGEIALYMNKAAHWILRYIINIKLYDTREELMTVDADQFLQNNKTLNEEDNADMNKEMFEKALAIRDTKLRECLVPRKEIERIDKKDSIETLKERFRITKLSKLVVTDGSIDNIIGYIHQLDLYNQPASIENIIHPIPVVPESMNATDLMNKFAKERKSMAWVIDEFGGTAGIVTMEDLLEEIFGEIEDEFDDMQEYIEQQIASNEFIFSGRLELDHIRDKFNLHFSDDTEAETLSGYIIEKHEAIPQQNERIILDNYEYNILNVNGTRIETVKLRIL